MTIEERIQRLQQQIANCVSLANSLEIAIYDREIDNVDGYETYEPFRLLRQELCYTQVLSETARLRYVLSVASESLVILESVR